MLPIKHILLPVDLSERSAAAAEHAKLLATHYGARVSVVHVMPPLFAPVGSMEAGTIALTEMFESRKQEAQTQCASFSSQHLSGIKATDVLLVGDPAHQIVQYAHDEKTDVIVMPTHGYGPFRRFILGSVAAKVLHDADCPVWTGAHLEDPPPLDDKFGTIVAAVDLGKMSERVLEWASQFAADHEAKLIVAHATPNLEGRTGEYFDPDWRTHLIRQARERIDALLSKAGVEAEVTVESGDPAHVVHRAAERAVANLVVIGRRAEAGIIGRLKADAYSIIRQSPCPVVSV
ncbi:MAG: universal stress protein [Bryobacteraceae bacterium]